MFGQKTFALIAIVLALAIFYATKPETTSAGETAMNATAASIESLAAANNEFGFDLFAQLRSQDKDKNVFFSPLSIATALAMTYNGAAGETHLAMKRVLKYGTMNHAELNQSSAALMAKLKGPAGNNDPKIELLMANSLWARQGIAFNPAFLDRNRQFFGAEIAALDFAKPQALQTINGWVSRNTKGKIPKIIEQISGDQVMFLINAVYFKGQWQKRFDAKLTQNLPFHLLAGKTKQTQMMSQSGSYQYFKGENFQAVSLPYGQGGASIYLFLPDEKSSLNNLLSGLSYQKWQQWMTNFRNSPGDVKLPRFKMDYSRDLNNPLRALGMGVAFDRGKADFSGIRQQKDLFISQVKHKAVIEVNEEGTEAAAATSVGISITSVRREPQRFSFIADRPFLLAIRDQQTGAILFMGAVFEPM
ncbi:MAG: serpin family protein [Acidobacteriota bacterium]